MESFSKRGDVPEAQHHRYAKRAGVWRLLKANFMEICRIIHGYPSILLYPCLLLALLLGLGIWGVVRIAQADVDTAKLRAAGFARDTASWYVEQLSLALSPVSVMVAIVRYKPQHQDARDLFLPLAPSLFAQAPANSLLNLQLVPHGVVADMYPQHGQEAALGYDVFTALTDRDAARKTVRDGVATLAGPLPFRQGGFGVIVRQPIFISTNNSNETFGIERPVGPYCGEPCQYNATSGTIFWGFAAALISLNYLNGPGSRLDTILSRGYGYQLLAPNVTSGELETVASNTEHLIEDYRAVEIAVPLPNAEWKLRVYPLSGWRPSWYSGLIAAVVLIAVALSCLTLALLLSRRQHELLLKALLPKDMIRELKRDRTAPREARIMETETPADLLLGMMGALLEGRPPDLGAVVFIRTVLTRNMDIYQPYNLRNKLRGSSLDADVVNALMRQLGDEGDLGARVLSISPGAESPCDDGLGRGAGGCGGSACPDRTCAACLAAADGAEQPADDDDDQARQDADGKSPVEQYDTVSSGLQLVLGLNAPLHPACASTAALSMLGETGESLIMTSGQQWAFGGTRDGDSLPLGVSGNSRSGPLSIQPPQPPRTPPVSAPSAAPNSVTGGGPVVAAGMKVEAPERSGGILGGSSSGGGCGVGAGGAGGTGRSGSNLRGGGGGGNRWTPVLGHNVAVQIVRHQAVAQLQQLKVPIGSAVIEESERILSGADGWQFDAWALQEATRGHALSALGFFLIQRAGLIKTFRLKAVTLARLLRQVEVGYLDNPYHNAVHAADVLQTLHVIIHAAQLHVHYLDPLGLLAAYYAAIVHDFGHPGLTADFLVATSDVLAVRYNDRSPLENHHCAASFRMLQRTELDVLAPIAQSERAAFRKMVIELVLATDMKQHFSILSHFNTVHRLSAYSHHQPQPPQQQQRQTSQQPASLTPSMSIQCTQSTRASAGPDKLLLARPSPPGLQYVAPKPVDETERLLSLQVVLKCADIGHLGEVLEVHQRWLEVLEEEFFRQGDRESDLGLPISPLFDRAKQGVSKSQVGFYDFVALPLVHALVSAFPGAQPLMSCFIKNYNHWRVMDGQPPVEVPRSKKPATQQPAQQQEAQQPAQQQAQQQAQLQAQLQVQLHARRAASVTAGRSSTGPPRQTQPQTQQQSPQAPQDQQQQQPQSSLPCCVSDKSLAASSPLAPRGVLRTTTSGYLDRRRRVAASAVQQLEAAPTGTSKIDLILTSKE